MVHSICLLLSRYPPPYWLIYLFGVLCRFQHCTGHITTGSWKGRGNQYIQFVRGFCTVNCRPTASNYQLSQLRSCRESNPSLQVGGESVITLPPWPLTPILESLVKITAIYSTISQFILIVGCQYLAILFFNHYPSFWFYCSWISIFYLFVCFGLSSRLRLDWIGISFFIAFSICLLTKAIKISPEL